MRQNIPLHSFHMQVIHLLRDQLPGLKESMPYKDLHSPPTPQQKDLVTVTPSNWYESKQALRKNMKQGRKKYKPHRQRVITLHLSTLTNSTCFPPLGVVLDSLGTPTSSSKSASLAPPHTAESRSQDNEKIRMMGRHQCFKHQLI